MQLIGTVTLDQLEELIKMGFEVVDVDYDSTSVNVTLATDESVYGFCKDWVTKRLQDEIDHARALESSPSTLSIVEELQSKCPCTGCGDVGECDSEDSTCESFHQWRSNLADAMEQERQEKIAEEDRAMAKSGEQNKEKVQ